MLRDTGRNTQPVIIEYGYLDNASDANRLKENYQKYAEAVVQAVLQYIGEATPEGTLYTVQSGDSLWGIAKKFNTTVDAIKNANNLSGNVLSVGQVLQIPTTNSQPNQPSSGNIYTVKNGDSLYKIAQTYNTTVDELMRLNNLTSTNLRVGQQLKVPTSSSNTQTPTGTNTYIVKSGDTLYKIAQIYNTTANELIRLNNLTKTNLSIGQRLIVPASGTSNVPSSGIEYVVKNGDSLYKIAQTYNTTVDAIMQANNLNSTALSIGQVLRIPSISTNRTYTVKNGDSLWSIAQAYNTTVDEIKRKNNLTTNTLQIGQVLQV